MVALALMVSCMPSAYTISASEAFGDGTDDIFTDGEFTSGPTAEESTPDVSGADQAEQEQAQQTTLTYENDSVKVTAEALEDGALPQNTTLKADTVNENSSVSCDTVSQKLSTAAVNKGSSLRGFFAYDVYFADGDGNRVEPNGRIRVTFEYKTPAAPELTDAASTSVTVEKLHYNSSTGDTDVNTLQANEDLKVLNVNEGKQIQTLQVETGNAAVFAVMWDSPETAEVNEEAVAEDTEDVSDNADEVSIASEEFSDASDISDEPEQDAAETPAAEEPEVTPDAEPTEEPTVEPTETPDAEPTEAPAEEEPAEDIESPDEVPAADENSETSLIEVVGDETNLRVSPSTEAEVLETVNAGTQLTLLDTVTAEDGATWYKVSYEGTEAYIRSDMAQIVEADEEVPEDVQEEEIQPEITRYDYKSDEVNVKVTLTDPADLPDNAELSVTPVELSQEAEDQITEEAIKEKKAIEKIHSYDIKFLVDGEEVQPGNTVKVSVSLNDEKKIKDADVYHVDAEDNIENMDGSVAKNGDVEFETTHFSTYVIVDNKRDGQITVTLQHYDATATTGTKIYADDVKTLTVGQKVDCKKATNWDIKEVKVVTNGTEKIVAAGDIELAQDATVKVYYTPTTGTFAGAPTFYDYTVKAGQSGNTYYSINQKSNYSNQNSSDKLSMGEAGEQNYSNYRYTWLKDGYKVNKWTGSDAVITGLLKGLDSSGNVVFNNSEPGFFKETDLLAGSSTDNYLRKVYRDYTLNFERIGDTYTLTGVTDGNGTNVTSQYTLDKTNKSGEDFFPLDTVASSYEESYKKKATSGLDDDGKTHNYYFGMRYDIKFKLGDYVGPLSYTFTGDDDMWVVMDGGKADKNSDINDNVIIDLGGIHNAATKTVDLWDYLLTSGQTKDDLTDDQKNEEHTLTVLYMERGAGASNCYMNFTLPNATISQVTTDALGILNLQKVKSDKTTELSGAKFALYSDKECTTQIATATSGDDGNVTFDKLRAGTYYLKEIQAPAGYVASNAVWTVIVTKKSKTSVKVELKDSAGNAVENNKIINQTKEEIIKSSMEYDKTAKVKDWDQRTYDIDITAKSTSTSSTVIERDSEADIMMVFDMSGSMNADGSLSTVGQFDSVKDSLDMTKVYYYNTQSNTASVSQNIYYSNPMVYIDGKWQYYNGSTWKEPSNYGYVSTWNSRITALKEAAIAFIKDTASKSPNSKIGITTFDGYVNGNSYATRGNEIYGITSVGSSPSDMIKAVSKITADGGTSPQKGLEKASSQLESVKDDGLSKYIILFTDGAPSETSDTEATETSISTLKQSATIFTVALCNSNLEVPGSNKNNIEWMKDLATDEQHAFNASDSSKLGLIFQKIQETINQNIEITNATITDVIDPRFVIVNDNNNKVITNEDLANGKTITLKNGGVVSLNEEEYQVVTWNKQTIPNKADGKEWSKTITVKAKEDYIGGNNIPTNVSPDSKISTGYGDAILPQPSVNVKLLSLDIGDDETTVFKGDPIDPTGYKDELAKTLKVKELDGTTTTITGVNPLINDKSAAAFPTLTPDQKKELLENDTITLGDQKSSDGKYPYEYIYPGTTDAVGYFTYTYKVSETPGGNMTSHEATTVGTAVEKYELVVTYHPYSTETRKAMPELSNVKEPTEEGGTEVFDKDIAPVTGTYIVNVIAGQIQITKKLEEPAKKDATFEFKIYKDGTKESDVVKKVTATVKAGETEAKFTVENNESAKVIVAGLARGEYTVEEVSQSGYQLVSAENDSKVTNCKSEKSNDITFSIGTDNTTEHKNALEAEDLKKENVDYAKYAGPGCVGKVDYTNKEIVADVDFVKVDASDNKITLEGAEFTLYKADESWTKGEKVEDVTSGNDGTFGFKKLLPGNYLLEETKAATGYSLVTEPWKIVVDNEGNVTVTKNDGTTVIAKNSGERYMIENAKLYSLPESGGPGTYGFTISGVAILATALLLFINNKRREEEAKHINCK